MKNSFPVSRVVVADSQGRKHVLVIACNNTTYINQNGSHSVASSIGLEIVNFAN